MPVNSKSINSRCNLAHLFSNGFSPKPNSTGFCAFNIQPGEEWCVLKSNKPTPPSEAVYLEEHSSTQLSIPEIFTLDSVIKVKKSLMKKGNN